MIIGAWFGWKKMSHYKQAIASINPPEEPRRRSSYGGYNEEEPKPVKQTPPSVVKKPNYIRELVLIISGFVWLFLLLFGSIAVSVSATQIAVVENTVTGQFDIIQPGTAVWPFTNKLVPFVTRITTYDLRRQTMEIGEGDTKVKTNGIEASSGSPGNPKVYFWARGWAYPNPEKIIELHKKYGRDYMTGWVEKNWISTIKAVQGTQQYNYVSNARVEMENTIEKSLQEQLVSDDGQPLVYISQLAIVNFAFEDKVDAYLDGVASKEFERQQAEQQILINKNKQEAEKISADTAYIVTKRNAEAEQAKLVAEAQGQADATKLKADADAYAVDAKYKAESEGVKKIQQALANSPQGYLEYLLYTQWNGVLPVWMTNGSSVPFIDIPTPSSTAAPTTK